MGRMGTFLDLLPDEARDRVIEGQFWITGEFVAPTGGRCLIGHAHDFVWDSGKQVALHRVALPPLPFQGQHFDRACHRFGMERVVRAIKARAARNHAPASQVVQPTAERSQLETQVC